MRPNCLQRFTALKHKKAKNFCRLVIMHAAEQNGLDLLNFQYPKKCLVCNLHDW